MEKIAVLIPCFNERATIEKEINEIRPRYDRVIEMVKSAMVFVEYDDDDDEDE